MGFRDYRLFNIAIADVVLSYLAAFLLLRHYNVNHAAIWSFGVFLVGIMAHMLLGINTELNYKLGLSDAPIRK